MYLSSNLKFLRKTKKLTQACLSESLNIKRPTYNGYENNVAYPGLDLLIKISEFYQISIDILLKFDLSKLDNKDLYQLQEAGDAYLKGSNIRILTHTVDAENEENIELVNIKAKAGYSAGYSDPDFIRVLPVFQLPFLSKNKKYRSFQISGDSMEPIPHGSYIIAEYIQNWLSLKDGDACVILTVDEGIVFKCIKNKLKEEKKLELYSLNKTYDKYSVKADEIKEVWKFVNYISNKIPDENNIDIKLHKEIANLKNDVKSIKNKLNATI